jgi:hypothetical protein
MAFQLLHLLAGVEVERQNQLVVPVPTSKGPTLVVRNPASAAESIEISVRACTRLDVKNSNFGPLSNEPLVISSVNSFTKFSELPQRSRG